MEQSQLMHIVAQLHGHGAEASQAAQQLLTSQNKAEILPMLRKGLQTDSVPQQLNVAHALLIVDCATTVGEVLFLLRASEDWVRYHMCGLLLDYGHALAFDDLMNLARNDPAPSVRGHACVALGSIGGENCIGTLEWVALADEGIDAKQEPVRDHAVRALATLARRFAGLERDAGCR